jgi:hypothetical protein
MNIGLLQGRLSKPTNGHIQEFPEDWEAEFETLKECGLCGVEWLVTPGKALNNPIYNRPEQVDQYPITSICLDTMVDSRIILDNYVDLNLGSLCKVLMSRTSIRNITIPLLEDSSMCANSKREKFSKIIQRIGNEFPEINFSFEAELGIKELKEIVSLCDNFYVTYDTGNITSFGLDHVEYINSFFGKINNVHLKDRTFDSKTVEPLTGDTDFELIFRLLKSYNYKGNYILQTARSTTGQEKQTILRHKKIFEGIYEQIV